MQKIVPFLWFDGNAEEAMGFYTSVFRDSKVVKITRYKKGWPGPEGAVMVGKFQFRCFGTPLSRNHRAHCCCPPAWYNTGSPPTTAAPVVTMDDKIRGDIDAAVAVLHAAGAKEVYVFGSAAEGRDTPDSDIDLAVRGIPPESFFEAVGRVALAIARDFDIVDLDDGTPFTEFLLRKGKLARVA